MRFHLLPKIVLFHPSNDHFRAMRCNALRRGAVMMKYLAAGKAGWIMSAIHINVMERGDCRLPRYCEGVQRNEISTLSTDHVTRERQTVASCQVLLSVSVGYRCGCRNFPVHGTPPCHFALSGTPWKSDVVSSVELGKALLEKVCRVTSFSAHYNKYCQW